MGAVLNLMQPGGGGGMAWPPTAEEVYALTRPADWLALPQPAPGEVYMLALIPAEGSALLAFTVECTGNWTAAVGTVSGGAFVPTESAALASGAVWESELAAADFGDVTEEGFAQAVVKLSGAGITAVAPAAHSARSNFTAWGVAEISCLLPDGAEFRCGGTTARTALAALRYFSGGGGKLKGNFASGPATLGAFQMCQSLVCAMGVGTAGQTDLSGMFSGCTSLLAVSGLDCSSALDVSNMFMNCVSLPAAPELDLSSAETLAGLFRGCEALRSAGDISAPLAALGYAYDETQNAVKISTTDTTQTVSVFVEEFTLNAGDKIVVRALSAVNVGFQVNGVWKRNLTIDGTEFTESVWEAEETITVTGMGIKLNSRTAAIYVQSIKVVRA